MSISTLVHWDNYFGIYKIHLNHNLSANILLNGGLYMILHSYYSNSGKNLILDYVNSLPEDKKTDGLSVLECM